MGVASDRPILARLLGRAHDRNNRGRLDSGRRCGSCGIDFRRPDGSFLTICSNVPDRTRSLSAPARAPCPNQDAVPVLCRTVRGV